MAQRHILVKGCGKDGSGTSESRNRDHSPDFKDEDESSDEGNLTSPESKPQV